MRVTNIARVAACAALLVALAAGPFGAGSFAAGPFAAGTAQAQGAGQMRMQEGRIVVSAEGRVAAAPDMATVTVGVVAEAETAEAALAQMSDAAAALLDVLGAQGVAAADRQTSGISLEPRYRREPDDRDRDAAMTITGYTAQTSVTARVRALDTLGGVLDAAVRSGANRLQGLSFGLSDPTPIEDAARRAAVAEATRRAALHAEAAGVGLGRLLRLEEGGAASPRPMMRAEMAVAAAPVPVAEGELEVRAQVRMVWAIETP